MAKDKKNKDKGFVAEFKKFIMRGNVMDMAVGVIIGGAFTKIVNSVVSDIITPALGLLTGNVDFAELKVVLSEAVMEGETVVKEELPDNIDRRIFIFERASQFDLLSENSDTFMWVSPIPSEMLEDYEHALFYYEKAKQAFTDERYIALAEKKIALMKEKLGIRY